MSSPVNRTALREEENRSGPPSQAHNANDVNAPDTVDSGHQRTGTVDVPGRGYQPPAQPIQMLRHGIHNGQRGVHLEPTHQRELLVDDRGQPRPGAADHPGFTQRGGALVEAGRVDALRPAGVLEPKVVVELQQRPPLQHR